MKRLLLIAIALFLLVGCADEPMPFESMGVSPDGKTARMLLAKMVNIDVEKMFDYSERHQIEKCIIGQKKLMNI